MIKNILSKNTSEVIVNKIILSFIEEKKKEKSNLSKISIKDYILSCFYCIDTSKIDDLIDTSYNTEKDKKNNGIVEEKNLDIPKYSLEDLIIDVFK